FPASNENENLDSETDRFVELAAKRIEQLRPAVKTAIQAQQAALHDQLARADRLVKSNRDAAQQIWRGIVTLYGQKSWAKPQVDEAESRLRGQPARTH